MKIKCLFVFEDFTFTARCCTASISFLERAMIAVTTMEPMKMRVGATRENMLLSRSRLRMDCEVVKSPVKFIVSQINLYNMSKLGLKFWSGVMSKLSGQLALC